MTVSNRHRLVFLALLVLVFAAKGPTWSTPYYWDETSWIARAQRLAQLPLWHVVPGLAGAEFSRRPPGLFIPTALLFKLTRPSIWLSHALIACFALLGVYFTYRLGELLYGATAGLLAALFLFCNAIYFAQAGMFLSDLPTAACGVASVAAMLRRRYAQYLFWALWVVLLKETGMAVVLAVSAYAALREWRHGRRAAMGAALRWGVPLLAIGAFYTLQRLTTGRFFIDIGEFFGQRGEFLDLSLASSQVRRVTYWLFEAQLRWVFTALIVAGLVFRPAVRRPELLLFLFITLCSGYAFSVIYLLPRYLLPVAPYLFVAAAGALVALLPRPAWHLSAAAALIALMVARLPGTPPDGNNEWDMGYLAAVRTYQACGAYLEQRHPTDRILATWPLSWYLRRPELGIVTQPLNAVHPHDVEPLESAPGFDVAIDDSLGDGYRDRVAATIQRHGWPLVHRFAESGFRCDIYAAKTTD